jgi:hypothetical protein
MEGIMTYVVEMSSGAMIYISSFIEIGAGILKLMGRGVHRHKYSMEITQAHVHFFKIRKYATKRTSNYIEI